jgi:hypothetical protein
VSGDEYGKSATGVDCGGPRPGRPRAALKQSKRTNVIKSALAVYHWFVRQALTAGKVVSRKPIGPEVTLETAELAALEGKGNLLSPAELGLLQATGVGFQPDRGRSHQGTPHARLLRHLSTAVPKVRRQNLPAALFR